MTQHIRGIAKSIVFYFLISLHASYANEENNSSILESSTADNDFYLSRQYCQIAVEALGRMYENGIYRENALKECRDAQKSTVGFRKENNVRWAQTIKEKDFNGYVFFLKKGAREYESQAVDGLTTVFLKEAGKTIPKKSVAEFLALQSKNPFSHFSHFIYAIHLCEGMFIEKNTKLCAEMMASMIVGPLNHYAPARYYYAWMFENGIGVTKDKQKAHFIMESIHLVHDRAQILSDIQLFRMEEADVAEENKISVENMDKAGIIDIIFLKIKNFYGFGGK